MKTIRTKLISIIIIAAVIPAVICGSVCLAKAGRTMNHQNEQQVVKMAEKNSSVMNEIVRQMTLSVQQLNTYAVGKCDDLGQFKENPAYVEEYSDRIHRVVNLIANSTRGALTCYVRYNPEYTDVHSGWYLTRKSKYDEFKEKEPEDFKQYPQTDTDKVGWYYIPVANGTGTWLDAYYDKDRNTYVVPYVEPIHVDGETIGVVGMEFDLSEWTKQVDEDQALNGYAVITDSENRILYHPSVSFGTALLNASNGLDQLNKIVSAKSKQGTVIRYTSNEDKIAVYYDLDNGMKLIQTAPVSSVQKEANTLFLIVLVVIVATLVLAAIAALSLSHGIADPIEKITKEIRDIAKLNISNLEAGKKFTTMKDETGTMAREVVNMNDKLRYIVSQMNYAKDNMYNSVAKLSRQVADMDMACNDTNAATQEVEQTMQNVKEQIRRMDQSVTELSNHAKHMQQLSGELQNQPDMGKNSESGTKGQLLQALHYDCTAVLETIQKLSSSMAEVNATVSQTAGGISVAVEKNTTLTDGMKEVNALISGSRRSVENLARVVQQFQL